LAAYVEQSLLETGAHVVFLLCFVMHGRLGEEYSVRATPQKRTEPRKSPHFTCLFWVKQVKVISGPILFLDHRAAPSNSLLFHVLPFVRRLC